MKSRISRLIPMQRVTREVSKRAINSSRGSSSHGRSFSGTRHDHTDRSPQFFPSVLRDFPQQRQRFPSAQLVSFISTRRRTFASESKEVTPKDDENESSTSSSSIEGALSTQRKRQRPTAGKNKKNHLANKTVSQLALSTENQMWVLSLRHVHPASMVEDHYERVAKLTQLHKFKWIQTLQEQIADESDQHHPQRKVWEATRRILGRNSIPEPVKDMFWNLIIAPIRKKQKRKFPALRILDHHMQVLSQARDNATSCGPMLWSREQKRNIQERLKTERMEEAGNGVTSNLKVSAMWREYMKERGQTLTTVHASKSESQRADETRALIERLSTRLPATVFQNVIALFRDYNAIHQSPTDKGKDGKGSGNKKSPPLYWLSARLAGATKTHFHLVARELADFFYVTEQDMGEECVDSDHRVVKSNETWNEAKVQFVDSFMAIQPLLVEEHEQNVNSESENNRDILEENASGSEAEDALQSFYNGTTAESTLKARSKSQAPKHYTVFEAISAHDWAHPDDEEPTTILQSNAERISLEMQGFPSVAASDRLVFIDNLPIDIDEEKLMDAYSRCGDIETLSVFHRRPDLDPGRKKIDSKKKIRNPSTRKRKWERPRTPVYGMVLFKTSAGASKAVSDTLRIFGMVLDKHLIRSYKPSNMTSLFLENVSASNDIAAVEYELCQALHPELYIGLDVSATQRQRVGSSHCEIKFPNFEATYWAYLKLSASLDLLSDNDCQLQWMKTPYDSMMYWTRQLNY